jgi:hypothetical protein
MATAAVVWRDAVTDIFKDALGHSRVHRAESLLNNLQRGGYGTLDAMRRADEADLVACGCPEDVASVVLSELNAPSGYYGGDDDDGECPCVCARMYCFYGMALDLAPRPRSDGRRTCFRNSSTMIAEHSGQQ